MVNEWRYYVLGGNIITSGWYDGSRESAAPSLQYSFPGHFSGAGDFGETEDETIELVESHAPFACGWYGEDHEAFIEWQYLSLKDKLKVY